MNVQDKIRQKLQEVEQIISQRNARIADLVEANTRLRKESAQLQDLYTLLRAKNQTEAVAELHKLIHMAYEKRS